MHPVRAGVEAGHRARPCSILEPETRAWSEGVEQWTGLERRPASRRSAGRTL